MSGFHCLTRTWKTGYRFTPNDRDAEERFYRHLRTAGIFGTEEPFAVLVDDCVIAGGMETGKRDKEGRPVRFSFMLDGDTGIFCGLAAHWDDAEKFMRSCFDWEAYRHEEIIFAADEFVNELKTYGTDADIITPSRGHILKWDKSGISELAINEAKTKAKYSRKKIFALYAVIVMIAAGGFMLYTKDRRPETPAVSVNADAELREIYSGLRRALDTMREAYTFMSMISDDAGLAIEYSRLKSDEAERILDELDDRLKSFDITAGDL